MIELDPATARGVITSMSYSLAETPPHRLPRDSSKKAAAVAVLLRLDPDLAVPPGPRLHFPAPPNTSGDPRKARDDFPTPLPEAPKPLEANWTALDDLFVNSPELGKLPASAVQVLFLKRVWRPSDPWSGHVAFPGGRMDPGEGPYTTCVRETWEETGIWLGSMPRNDGNDDGNRDDDVSDDDDDDPVSAICLGRLPDRPARPSPMLISSFLFFLPPSVGHTKIELQKSEMAGYRWIPLDSFGSLTHPRPVPDHPAPLPPSVLISNPQVLLPPPSAPFRHSEAPSPLSIELPDSALPGRGIPTPSWPSSAPTRPFVTLSSAFRFRALTGFRSVLDLLGLNHVFMPSYLLPDVRGSDKDADWEDANEADPGPTHSSRHFQLWGLSLTVLSNVMWHTPARTRINWPPVQFRSWWMNQFVLLPYLRWFGTPPEAPPPPPLRLSERLISLGWALLAARILVAVWRASA